MVKELLAGRKTMTRRSMKVQPNENGVSFMPNAPLDWESIYKEEWKPWKFDTEEGETVCLHCPYGEVRDLLWARETFQKGTDVMHTTFKADIDPMDYDDYK